MTPGASWGRRTSGATASPGATRTSGELWRRLSMVRQSKCFECKVSRITGVRPVARDSTIQKVPPGPRLHGGRVRGPRSCY